ncbi:MAG: hypothetical protein GC149_07380 [Gammaproteobacteria bacterium]|nr:hypothetical protein [Gammaproteobacteria bacterium]
MNIWALDKDISIKHVLLLLQEGLGVAQFCISTDAELDAMAVRIYRPGEEGMSAYLYTYGQQAERYGVHLEYPALPESAMSKNIEMQEDLNFDQLLAVLQVHLL